MRPLAKLGVGAVLALATGVAWQRVSPSACPYAQRWLLLFPRPWLTPEALISILEPEPGERLLEIGPGVGHGALPVAGHLEPGGTLAAFDLQQEMLDNLAERARARAIGNLEPTQGDATRLPYDDESFDGAYMVTVLGEVPDRAAALRELRRVLRPGARIVFGETLLDPHVLLPGTLRREAEAAGFRFDRFSGVPPLGFYARFSVA